MEHKTVGFAVCGSFCTHHRAMEALEAVKARYDHVIPIVSEVVADTDTRFGTAHDLMREMERICDHRVIATQKEAEPIGPKGLLDLLIIAPCTGSTLGKLACGIADNLLLTTYLSARCPVAVAPAMDLDMFAHSATQENLRILRSRGVRIVEPAEGELASGLSGKGRMAEPADIVAFVEDLLSEKKKEPAR